MVTKFVARDQFHDPKHGSTLGPVQSMPLSRVKNNLASNLTVQQQAATKEAARILQKPRPTLHKCELEMTGAGTCVFDSIRRDPRRMMLASVR